MSDQPAPDKYVEMAVELLRSRSRRGLAKYGVTLERDDLDFEQWLIHLIEEQADGLNYSIRALAKWRERNARSKKQPRRRKRAHVSRKRG